MMSPRDRAIIIAAIITAIGGIIVAFMYIVLPRVLPVQISTTTTTSFGPSANTPVIDTTVLGTQPLSPPVATQGSSPSPEPQPQSASEIASKLGGDSNGWSQYGSNGWVYRGVVETNVFTVPHWCVVDTPQGRFYPGEQVQQQVALTIYYNVRRYDLAGHNP